MDTGTLPPFAKTIANELLKHVIRAPEPPAPGTD
jgi:hypothetical protein